MFSTLARGFFLSIQPVQGFSLSQTSIWSPHTEALNGAGPSNLLLAGLLTSHTALTRVYIAVELAPFLTFRTLTGCSKKEAKLVCSSVTEERTEGGYGVKPALYLRPASGCYGNRNSSHHCGLLRTPPRHPLQSPTLHHSAASCLTLGLKRRKKNMCNSSFRRKLFPPEVKSK